MSQAAVMDKAERGAQLRRDGVIIRTWDLMKTYVMGDQTIHAVAGIDIESRRANTSPSWALRDRASRR
jgi:putative ABC transport system ATP-binding protein